MGNNILDSPRTLGTKGSRVIVVRSSDQGQTWHYQGTVSNEHKDPNPELPGMLPDSQSPASRNWPTDNFCAFCATKARICLPVAPRA
jgi:hypothetical protein